MRSSLKTYLAGWIISLLLTFAAFAAMFVYLQSTQTTTGHIAIIITVSALAIAQLCAQLFFFLHLGQEKDAKWNIITLLFAAVVIAIIFFGSLWIMYHLNYNMTPQQMEKYLINQDGI